MSEHNSDHSHHFIVPLKYYIGTFGGLLFLTLITVWLAQYDFGALNIVIAMLIASTKASLVIAFFMGLRWEKGFNRVMFFSSLIFLGIFIIFTLSDPATRGDIDPVEKGVFGIQSNVKLITHDGDNHHNDDGNTHH
jgi:cytochrome c oxidase subunit IV